MDAEEEKKRPEEVDTLITAHLNADFDALGSMLAASKLYPNSYLLWPGSMDESLRELVHVRFSSSPRFLLTVEERHKTNLRTLVAVDTMKKTRLKHVKEFLDRDKSALRVVLYDHHPCSDDDVEADELHHELLGSASALMVHKIKEYNKGRKAEEAVVLSPDELALVALGIYADTGCFTFETTTKKDFEAMVFLHSAGLDTHLLYEHVHHLQSFVKSVPMTASEQRVYQQIDDNAQEYNINGTAFTIAEIVSDEMISSALDRYMKETTTPVIFVIARGKDKLSLIGRTSSKEKIDVGQMCSFFGGGGHPCAASAAVKNLTPTELKDALFAHILTFLQPEVQVKSIMTSPCICICMEQTIGEALKSFLNSGTKKIVVTNPETQECVGIIDRIGCEKLNAHGYREYPVHSFMDTHVTSLASDSSLDLAIDLILRQRQRIILITEKEKLVGVVSRADVIAYLMKEPSRFPKLLSKKHDKNLLPLMSTRLPKAIFKLLKRIGLLGDSLSLQLYVVGGFVRDLLLERENDDVDIVVEGDAIVFADALNDAMGKKVQHHHDFKTAVVTLKDANLKDLKIDVATARLEYYPKPVQLPVVQLSSLKMDLYRRDFTINSMAIQLNKGKLGDLVDFFRAEDDLNSKSIRILHNLSFIEDPTRIYRAVRFEQRYGFTIESQTQRLIKNAMTLGVLEQLSGTRLFHEIQKILEDKKPVQCLHRMKALGLLEKLHPEFHSRFNDQDMQEAQEALNLYHVLGLKQQAIVWKVYFLALVRTLRPNDLLALMDRFNFHEALKREILVILKETQMVYSELKGWLKDSDRKMSVLYFALKKLPLEGVIFLITQDKSEDLRKKVLAYWTHLQGISLDISGNDLKASGFKSGPAFGQALHTTLVAKLDGKVSDKNSQLNFATNSLQEAGETAGSKK